jgi:peptidoglycan lytic transglycosylase G
VVEPPKLSRPTREQVYRRRVVALIVLSLAVAAAIWAGWTALKHHRNAAPPPPTTVAAPKQIRITFPEGLNTEEMARLADRRSKAITAAGYERTAGEARLPAGFGRPAKPEGFLFPDTYFVYDTDPATALVEKQLEDFRAKWRTVNMRYARSKNLTNYDILIIASIIEKEAVISSERPLVAAVIYNRLHQRMTLGLDSTIRYGLRVPGNESLTNEQLRNPSPYNTRIHFGLPPTPICNPGLDSIQAAAHPAKVDYLYFIAKADKKHLYFTSSYQDFLAYKAAHG